MIDELAALMQRQIVALERLENRMRTLELLMAADEERFLAAAVDELEDASERVAALELGRVLALTSAGFSPEVSAQELLEVPQEPSGASQLVEVLERLREVTAQVATTRERVSQVVAASAGRLDRRLAASGLYAEG